MAFKKVRGAIRGFVGSIAGDLNSITSGLSDKVSGAGNKFDQRIADSLSDLLTGLTGTRTSNIPAISKQVLETKGVNREARAKVLNDPGQGRAEKTPGIKTALRFPEHFQSELGQGKNLNNYIHFRSLERQVTDVDGENLYDIFLYIPDGLTDNLAVTYSEADKGIVEGLIGAYKSDMNNFSTEGLGTSKEEIGQIVLGAAPGGSILKQAAGQTVNPLKFQLFEGVSFRTYSYTFNLRPKNSNESRSIQNIIYAFKLSALPGTTGANKRIYTFPNEWAIRFRGPFKDHIDYPLVSICTGVEVNYSDGQSFSTFQDGTPMSVGLTLNFTETTTLTRDKYKSRSSAFGSTDGGREATQEGGSDLITSNDTNATLNQQAEIKRAKAREKAKQDIIDKTDGN